MTTTANFRQVWSKVGSTRQPAGLEPRKYAKPQGRQRNTDVKVVGLQRRIWGRVPISGWRVLRSCRFVAALPMQAQRTKGGTGIWTTSTP